MSISARVQLSIQFTCTGNKIDVCPPPALTNTFLLKSTDQSIGVQDVVSLNKMYKVYQLLFTELVNLFRKEIQNKIQRQDKREDKLKLTAATQERIVEYAYYG